MKSESEVGKRKQCRFIRKNSRLRLLFKVIMFDIKVAYLFQDVRQKLLLTIFVNVHTILIYGTQKH